MEETKGKLFALLSPAASAEGANCGGSNCLVEVLSHCL